jgi:hypothetical protein
MLLGMILVVSAISALAWTIWQAPLERDTPGDEVVTEAREAWQQLPIGRAVLAAAAVIVAVSTGLMTYPGGLSMAGASLAIITGSIGSQIEPVPAFYALRALLIYEPMLLLLAFASILTVIRTTTQFLDRLMLMWLMVGSVLLLLYQGQTAGHALLLVVPLAWLVSALLDRILTSDPLSIMQGEYFIYARNRQNLLNWLVASVVFLLLIMGGVHLQEVGRGLQSAPTDGSLSVYMEASFAAFRASATWAAITAMLMVVVYLLIGSYRGAQTAFQGFVLGFSVFMLVFNVGSGWNTAVVHAANPLEFWYGSTPAADTYLLRQTLVEISRRDTSGFPEIPVTIVTNADAGLREDGLVAWLVRDYPNARFVPSLTDALRDEIILLAETPEDPDLGGSYVGQRFGVRQRWAIDQQLRSADWLSWWMQRRTANGGMTVDHAVLWLRADVYDGVPADERPQG